MYADDTTLFCCLEDITSDNKEVVLNNELQHVHSWLSANRLTLNVQKTKYMLFHKNKSNDIGELIYGYAMTPFSLLMNLIF